MKQSNFFARHLPILGKYKSAQIHKLTIVVVGVGALGCSVSQLLVRAGVQNMTLIDPDIVQSSNLHRQSLFSLQDVGKPKVVVAQNALEGIYADQHPCHIQTRISFVDPENIDKLVGNPDIIFDCCDNLNTKHLLNDYSIKHCIPLVFGSVEGETGMVKIIDDTSGCLSCFYDNVASSQSCATAGVLGWAAHMVASAQVSLGLEYLLEGKQDHNKQLHIVHAHPFSVKSINVKKKQDCVCCVQRSFSFLEQSSPEQARTMCGGTKCEVFVPNMSFSRIKDRFEDQGISGDQYLSIKIEDIDFLILKEGRIIVTASSESDARRKCHELLGI